MAIVLIPIDGSEASYRAVAHAAGRRNRGEQFTAIIVTVLAEPKGLSAEMTKKHRYTQINAMLADPKVVNHVRALVPKTHVLTGDVAPAIAEYARQSKCTEIVMGTRGLGVLGSMVMGSVASKLLQLVEMPITLVR
jgi:nucleotide-binding universal stress UspA family protein